MPKVTIALLGIAAAFAAGRADAQNVIDMKGTWTGTAQAIVDGPAGHHPPPGSLGTKPAGKYRLNDVVITLKIEGQDGRRFWGTVSSANRTERLMGSLSMDGRRVYMVDDDGYLDGTVVNVDTLDLCYRHVTAESAVVACELMFRK